MPEITAQQWESYLANFPDAHILQTRAWGDLKSTFGWSAGYAISSPADGAQADLGAQVLFRRLPMGWSAAYIAKGPVGKSQKVADPASWGALLSEADRLCLQRRSVFLKIEPDLWQSSKQVEGGGKSDQHIHPRHLRESQQSIQPRRTLVVDLTGDEEQVLSRMKQKTRYNIRLAIKKGLVAYPSTDLETFYRLMTETGQRDAFGVHSRQ
jgi:lipid II:glycine glycyltransferase (peptidoglycan interpeptide bridge formation enzyme)